MAAGVTSRPAIPNMSRRDGGAALLGALELIGLGAAPLAGLLLGAPAGRRARPGQGARPAARHVARVAGRRAPLVPYGRLSAAL